MQMLKTSTLFYPDASRLRGYERNTVLVQVVEHKGGVFSRA